MFLRNRRGSCVIYCLFAQLFLVSLAVGALWWEVRTFADFSLFKPPEVGQSPGEGTTLRGWPVVWAEWRKAGTYAPPPPPVVVTHGRRQFVIPQQPVAVYSPVELRGWNPAFPGAVLLIAFCFPALMFNRALRAMRDGGPSQGNWFGRLMRVGTLAGVVGVTVTVVEMETASQKSVRYLGYSSGIEADSHPPSHRLDTLIVDLRQGWFAPPEKLAGQYKPERVIHESQVYQKTHEWSSEFRRECLPEPFNYKSANGVWRFRMVTTSLGIVSGLFLGCLLFRPWQRPKDAVYATDGAAGASGPSL